ncbi:Dystonin [Amphibalanus amphitrite]|uniref:Dystonin n=1 Tax=Amphibalanus amphitrite TaxID=1232801 RepID=A0A6A4W4S5_AMPAM|nr:Dystonin [Amphibalanus amphitrite]
MEPQYYKERLGFSEPLPPTRNGRHSQDRQPNGVPVAAQLQYETNVGYEENLSKFKDERDAIQKKTFTKWVNKHLKKRSRLVRDLFYDLRDGTSLLALLEVLSGERLPSQKGQLRFHQMQNVQVALDFLRYRKIKLVNIRADDIVDGNPKLTLGLIWTIILHFQWERNYLVLGVPEWSLEPRRRKKTDKPAPWMRLLRKLSTPGRRRAQTTELVPVPETVGADGGPDPETVSKEGSPDRVPPLDGSWPQMAERDDDEMSGPLRQAVSELNVTSEGDFTVAEVESIQLSVVSRAAVHRSVV